MLLTLFIPILKVYYSSQTIDAFVTINRFNSSLTFIKGNSSLPSYSSSLFTTLLFLLVLIAIILTIYLVVTKKNQYATYSNTVANFLLFILFLNYYLITTINGHMSAGIVPTVTLEPGFFLIIFSLLLLFSSSFISITPPITASSSSVPTDPLEAESL